MKPAPFFPKFKKPSEALAAAKRLIRPIRRWTTGELAIEEIEDGEVEKCKTTSKNAVAFCALGGLQRVDGPVFRSARAYLREAAKQYIEANDPSRTALLDLKPDDDHIFHVNDEIGHKAVMNMFSRAIRAAKKDGK